MLPASVADPYLNPDPDPLVRGMDPRIRIHTKMSDPQHCFLHYAGGEVRNAANPADFGGYGGAARKQGQDKAAAARRGRQMEP